MTKRGEVNVELKKKKEVSRLKLLSFVLNYIFCSHSSLKPLYLK